MNEIIPTPNPTTPPQVQVSHWKTTWTATLAALTSALTLVAALPVGDPSDPTLAAYLTLIPPQYKGTVVWAGLIATVILKVMNAIAQADKSPKVVALPPAPTTQTADPNTQP